MTELVLDLHLHSRFSRAVSSKMNIPNMYLWGRKKGINILSAADFLHPVWNRELQQYLEETQEGIFAFKNKQSVIDENPDIFRSNTEFLGPYFMLSCEVSSIYKEGDAVHRIHNLIFAPNFAVVEKIRHALIEAGVNLSADGRPILGLSTKNLCELLFAIDPKIAVIPCHVWTPWFSLYGSRSGYDRIVDCFGEYASRIFAFESGLSSEPAMNWRIAENATRSIVSFSDAHSLEKMGREATVLRLKNGMSNDKLQISNNKKDSSLEIENLKLDIQEEDITYANILNAFVRGHERVFEIAYTIEFYPEEGKYHFTGHRNCHVSFSPEQTREKGDICPVCGKPLTVGVMHRVDELASIPDNNYETMTDENGLVWTIDKEKTRPPFVMLVPLLEVISEAVSSGVSSQKVVKLFDTLIAQCGTEHDILMRTPLETIEKVAGSVIKEAIQKVRTRDIVIEPGFDGEYGKVQIFEEKKDEEKEKPQLDLGF